MLKEPLGGSKPNFITYAYLKPWIKPNLTSQSLSEIMDKTYFQLINFIENKVMLKKPLGETNPSLPSYSLSGTMNKT